MRRPYGRQDSIADLPAQGDGQALGLAAARSTCERGGHLRRALHEERLREREAVLEVPGVVQMGGREADIPLECGRGPVRRGEGQQRRERTVRDARGHPSIRGTGECDVRFSTSCALIRIVGLVVGLVNIGLKTCIDSLRFE